MAEARGGGTLCPPQAERHPPPPLCCPGAPALKQMETRGPGVCGGGRGDAFKPVLLASGKGCLPGEPGFCPPRCQETGVIGYQISRACFWKWS